MIIDKNGKQCRNLEEQVKKNQEDIRLLELEGLSLSQFGITIKDVLATVDDIPHFYDPDNYEGETGDGYAVGTSNPYSIYVYTNTATGVFNHSWVNLGEFPRKGTSVTSVVLNAQNRLVFTYDDGTSYITNPIATAQGPKGDTGERGPQGYTPYIVGDYWYVNGVSTGVRAKGIQGDSGGVFKIVSKLEYVSLLPPIVAGFDVYKAYLVKKNDSVDPVQEWTNYHLFVQIGNDYTTRVWSDVGPITEVGTDVKVGGEYQAEIDLDEFVGNAVEEKESQLNPTMTYQVDIDSDGFLDLETTGQGDLYDMRGGNPDWEALKAKSYNFIDLSVGAQRVRAYNTFPDVTDKIQYQAVLSNVPFGSMQLTGDYLLTITLDMVNPESSSYMYLKQLGGGGSSQGRYKHYIAFNCYNSGSNRYDCCGKFVIRNDIATLMENSDIMIAGKKYYDVNGFAHRTSGEIKLFYTINYIWVYNAQDFVVYVSQVNGSSYSSTEVDCGYRFSVRDLYVEDTEA